MTDLKKKTKQKGDRKVKKHEAKEKNKACGRVVDQADKKTTRRAAHNNNNYKLWYGKKIQEKKYDNEIQINQLAKL